MVVVVGVEEEHLGLVKFSFFNTHSEDFHTLHNEGRQYVDMLLFLKKFLFRAMGRLSLENDSGFIIHGS